MSEHKRSRVLIVDDDDVVLATTGAVLEASGYEVTTHKGSFGASSVILNTRPDLVLLDMRMPGLSGRGLASLVQDEAGAEGIRIYFYSSSDDTLLQQAVEETGADGYIRKGNRSELPQQVAQALGGTPRCKQLLREP